MATVEFQERSQFLSATSETITVQFLIVFISSQGM